MKQNIPFSRVKASSFLPQAQAIVPEPKVIDPAEETRDLVTYLASLLPANVDPVHVLLGIGIAFAGVTGGIILFQNLNRGKVEGRGSDMACNGGGSPTGVLILHQCPRGRKTPCIAPYPLKLETFLRVAGINFEIENSTSDTNNNDLLARDSMVILDMEKLPDSEICMRELSSKFGVDLSSHLTPTEKGVEQAFNHLLEQKIYWGLSLYRWVYDGARSLERIQYLPDSTRDSIQSVARTVEHAAWHHGIGKRNPTEVIEEVIQDLYALSFQLGTKKFLMSDEKPTELDCTAFAMLSQIVWTMDGPLHTAVTETYKNLGEHCWRMRTQFWPDWEQCLQKS